MGFFSSRKTTFDPLGQYTPEQRKAVEALMSLASTGSGGGITLGQQYGRELGNYDFTEGEDQSLKGFQSLLSGSDLSKARDVYSSFADSKFNPDDPSSGYAEFSRALEKSGRESEDVLNRESAITGSRFGTNIQRQKENLAADLSNQRGMFLADLFNKMQDRKLQGARGLQITAEQTQGILQQIAEQSAIQRALKDQQAKDRYAEFNRARGEELSRIGLMQDEKQNPLGTVTKKSPSLFMSMLGEANPIVGSYNTHNYGYTTNQTSISDTIKAAMDIFMAQNGVRPPQNKSRNDMQIPDMARMIIGGY